MSKYQNMVNVFDDALRRCQDWRKDTVIFAGYVPMLLGRAIGCSEKV